jgi:DNA-binding Xre family transcriptional regulator
LKRPGAAFSCLLTRQKIIKKVFLNLVIFRFIGIFVSKMIPKHVFSMKRLYDTYTIYEFSDECIVKEICKRVKAIRLSCCFSQQEFADKAGVSIVTIKRIESCKVSDIALSTLLKILRISGTLEGVVGLVPELPDSPFLINEKTGKRIQRINGKRKMV